MPRSAKPRRRYVPRPIDADPMGLAMTGAALLTPAQRAPLQHRMAEAFAAFRAGRGTRDAWCDLADALNVAEALAELRIAADHERAFRTAQAVLSAVHVRQAARGSWTLYGAEITALDDALFVHGVQLEHCSQAELQRAIDTVRRRVGEALRGNASPRAMVCVAGGLGT